MYPSTVVKYFVTREPRSLQQLASHCEELSGLSLLLVGPNGI